MQLFYICGMDEHTDVIFQIIELQYDHVALSMYPFNFHFIFHFPFFSNGLSDTVYCSDWYALPIKYQKDVMHIIDGCQARIWAILDHQSDTFQSGIILKCTNFSNFAVR